jgi:ABC-type transport system substrate-binding protein
MSLQPAARRRSPVVTLTAALFLAAGVWLAADLSAQDPEKKAAPVKPKRTEDEDTDPKAGANKSAPADKTKAQPKGKREEVEEAAPAAPKKVPRVEDDETPAKPLTGKAGGGNYDLAVRARQSENPILKALYSKVKFPHDDFSYNTRPGQESVMPVPFFVGDDAQARWPAGGMSIHDLDVEGKQVGKGRNPPKSTVKSVLHFEQIAVRAVDDFLQQQSHAPDRFRLPREEQLGAAEAALTTAIRFHESAVATGVRKGEAWNDAVLRPLKSRLLDIQLEQLKALADAGNWDAAFSQTAVLAKEYFEPEEQARIARPLADFLAASLKSGVDTGEGSREALRRLHDLEAQFPEQPSQPEKNPLLPLRKGLRDRADSLFKRARELAEEKQMDQALKLIGQAVELWPEKDELRTFQRELMQQHSILRVGVRSLPEFMSPGRATTDSELRAVELLFEGLVKVGVDPRGNARFVPGLAEGRPKVESLARSFALPRSARWSNNQPLNGYDIRASVDRLVKKKGEGERLNPAWGQQLLEVPDVRGDPHRVRLPMAQGYLEPPSLMAFKVLPRPDATNGEDVDSPNFARNPVSSGPFVYNPAMNSESGRSCVSFVFNPFYGSRNGKDGLPRIKEVRFFAYKPFEEGADPTGEFDGGAVKLDLVLDLTPAHAKELKKKGHAATRVRVLLPGAGETPTRRVYFLAVNNDKSFLGKKEVRKAIAHAIDREKLLDDFFREKVEANMSPTLGRRLHTALNGPYPADSWACNSKVGEPKVSHSLDLFDAARAKVFKSELGAEPDRKTPIKLKYPDDDPAVKDAMEALCLQVQNVLGFKAEAVPVSPRKLREDVENGDYELAYYSYDFPDETYPLWPLLAPVKEGANIFRAPVGVVDQLFVETKLYRNFARVKQDTWRIHQALYDTMPFIPLWQIEPLAAVHDCVEAPWFDPLLVFTEIDRWKVSPR